MWNMTFEIKCQNNASDPSSTLLQYIINQLKENIWICYCLNSKIYWKQPYPGSWEGGHVAGEAEVGAEAGPEHRARGQDGGAALATLAALARLAVCNGEHSDQSVQRHHN